MFYYVLFSFSDLCQCASTHPSPALYVVIELGHKCGSEVSMYYVV